MALNGVMAVILRYFSKFGSFRGALRKSSRSSAGLPKGHKWHQTFEYHHSTPQPFYGPFFQDHPGEPVLEESFFWPLWC